MINIGKIEALKIAAIDAYMKTNGYDVEGDVYRLRTFSYGPRGGTFIEVTRPEGSSSSGGRVLHYVTDYGTNDDLEVARDKAEVGLQEAWAGICSTIDGIIDPWLTIPREEDFETAGTSSSKLIGALMGSAGQSGDLFVGSGALGMDMSRLGKETDLCISGGSFDLFKARYVDDGTTVGVRITAIAEVISQAIAAEKAVWKNVATDVEALVEEFTAGFKKAAQGDEANISTVLKVVGAAIAVGGALASGGTATAISLGIGGVVVGLGESLADADGDAKADGSFSSYADGCKKLEAAFTQLEDRIEDEEDSIRTALEVDIDNVRSNAGKFQTKAAGMRLRPGNHLIMRETEDGLVSGAIRIPRRFITEVCDSLAKAAKLTGKVSTHAYEAISRAGFVGNSSTGAWGAIDELSDLLKLLIRELAQDFDRGGDNLRALINALENAETQNTSKIDKIANAIQRGETHTGRERSDLLQPKPKTPGQIKMEALMF